MISLYHLCTNAKCWIKSCYSFHISVVLHSLWTPAEADICFCTSLWSLQEETHVSDAVLHSKINSFVENIPAVSSSVLQVFSVDGDNDKEQELWDRQK